MEVDRAAREWEEVILKQLEEKEQLPDKEDQMEWVRVANQHRAIAEVSKRQHGSGFDKTSISRTKICH